MRRKRNSTVFDQSKSIFFFPGKRKSVYNRKNKKMKRGIAMTKITIDLGNSIGIIHPNIYGHFAEHIGGVMEDGLWVGEESPVENIRGFRKKLIESFKKINPPIVRWPGGCFAETYDWRDGIGPREKRPVRVNWWYYHDGRLEKNQVGTHEFMDFCRLVGAEPYVAANITSLTPLHIRDWMEYCNFPQGSTTLAKEREANGDAAPFQVKYWGIGNENWGGGGEMTPEMYMQEYIRYSTICRPIWNPAMKFIFCGANGHDVSWTRRIMQEYSSHKYHIIPSYGMSIHYYCGGGECFLKTEEEWYDSMFRAAKMQRIIDDHRAAMDEFDPERKIKLIVDEWGNWHKEGSGPSKGYNLFEQQSTMRNAVVAALTLNIFNNRCDIVDMANVAQLCNNLHSLYLAAGDHLVETPTYHVFDLFKGHQGGQQRPIIYHGDSMQREGYDTLPEISAAASEKDGLLTLTLSNLHMTEEKIIALSAIGGKLQGKAVLSILSHPDVNACNTFENPDTVVPVAREIMLTGENDQIILPPASVAALTIGR
ncbi:MAG: alpha-N-arabinofuranosidase [Clostridiales bacterium]|nr:alpha-N-arabinofuranosidase [Clostridiales bacterium]